MKIAVLIPCYNEAASIGQVVRDVKAVIPKADIYVYDNNSTDQTAQIARDAGALVRFESYQGKGSVVRRMFADVEADVYVMLDGDATYDAPSIPIMIHKLTKEQLDMVTGVRQHRESEAYRPGHQFGNVLMTRVVHLFFGRRTADMLSGLRVFSRRFVKSFPAMSKGFEIETELTVYASSMRLPTADVVTPYYARPEGSVSKLSTFRDGWRILKMIATLIKEERPLLFFGVLGTVLFIVSLMLAAPVILTYFETGLVPRLPTALLSAAVALTGGVSWAIGLILDMVNNSRKELRRMRYLSIPVLRQE